MPKKGKRSQAAKARCTKKSNISIAANKPEDHLGIQSCTIQSTSSSVLNAHESNGSACISTIPASYHQGSNRFSAISRGFQCTTNALMFLAHYNERENLRSIDLDNILDKGDELYQNIVTDLVLQHKFVNAILNFDELPQTIRVDPYVYNVIKLESQCGLCKCAHNINILFPDLMQALQCFTMGVKTALLLAGRYCIAIFRSKADTYGIFDSHSRNNEGLTEPNGHGIMMNIPTLTLLLAQLYKLFDDLSLTDETQYELMPIEFKKIGAKQTEHLSEISSASPSIQETEDMDQNFELQKLKKLSKQNRKKVIKRIRRNQTCSFKSKNNEEKKLNRLKKLRQQYASDPQIKKNAIVHRYRNDPQYQAKQKKYIAQRYKTDPEFQAKQRQRIAQRYRHDLQFQVREKARITHRYENDSHFRAKQKQRITEQYKNDSNFRDKQKQRITEQYKNDSHFRAKQKQRITEQYKNDSNFRDKQKQRITEQYKNDSNFRDKQKQKITQRYKNDFNFQAKQKQNVIQRYKNDMQFRAKHKVLCALRIRKKYNQDNMFRLKKKAQSAYYKSARKNQKRYINIAIETFRKKIQAGPTYVCTVCHRAMFENQVKLCNRDKYKRNLSIVNECLTGRYFHKCCTNCQIPCTDIILLRDKEYICHSCDQTLLHGKTPPIAIANKLQLSQIPSELQGLNILERHVIAKFIPFAKILTLPKGGQKGVHGPVVCVPAETENIVNTLPRCTNDGEFLKVKLKRHLKFKGHYQFQTLSPLKVVTALQKLVQIHSQYTDVSVDEKLLCTPCNALCEICDNSNKEPNSKKSSHNNVQTHDNNSNHRDMDEPCSSNDRMDTNEFEQEKDETVNGICLDTCMQPVDIGQEVMAYDDKVLCIAPAQGNKPCNLFQVPKIEAMAFPVQFPDGNNTFDEPERGVKLSPSRYFNTRLFSVDNRFAQDTNYIFFAQFTTEMHLANSSMSTQLRKSRPFRNDSSKINSAMLKDKNQVNQLVKKDEGTRFMQPLRGTPAYWEKTMRDLFAMLRQLGTPTFFCTFSAAEMRWPEIITVIKAQQGETVNFDDLEWMEKCKILNSNPVTAMRMFDQRINILLKELIFSPSNPIGEIQDYFYRVEFQQRGSPHIHCLFWVKNAPVFDKDPDKKICEFVDRYITCELPNKEIDPELYTIVTEVQSHSKNHSKSCKKGNKACRFGFPQPPFRNTSIIRPVPIDAGTDESDAKQQEKKEKEAKEKLQVVFNLMTDREVAFDNIDQLLEHANLTYDEYTQAMHTSSTSSKIIMKRDLSDTWVNGYNKDLLRAWNANMDIQYILNPYCCIMYIVSYITKAEREMSEMLKNAVKEAQESSTSNREEIKKVMYVYCQNREVSTQESVARTCSLKLKSASRDVIFIPTDENNTRMSLPLSALENKDDDSEDIWMTSLPDRYKARPNTTEFHNMCMAEFSSAYRIVYGKTALTSKSVICLQNDLGFIQKRTRSQPAVIRYARFSQVKDPEKLFCTKLKLYLPYRTESQLKTRKFDTYESFYTGASVKLHGAENVERVSDIVTRNRALFEQHSDTIDKALTEYDRIGPIEDAWSMLAPATEVDRIESVMEREVTDPLELQEQDQIPELISNTTQVTMPLVEVNQVSDIDMQKMYQSLNEKQASEFYFVRDWCKKCVSGNKPEPFFHFVSGSAGTGKSHLINCIYAEATKILQKMPELQDERDISKPTVLLTAFTGTAAFNIHGKTLHSVFKMPFRLMMPYIGLGNQLDNLRSQLGHVQILVIDEISMVSKKLFAYVNWRLQQIRGTKRPFGNVSVLAVGDFQQLPPLGREKPLCVYEETMVDFWKENFQLIKLTEIMRQKEDVEFAHLLNRIRSKSKKDQLNDHDRNMLLSVTKELDACPPDLLHIYARNVDVNLQNMTMLHRKFTNIIMLDSDDYKKDQISGKMTKQDSPFKGTKNDLPDVLQIAIGARVMLTRNVDVTDGLVNGSFGAIAAIIHKPMNSRNVNTICIQFDHKDAGLKHRNTVQGIPENVVCIERFEEPLGKRNATRQQFPLKLAYACTMHKVQGMTTRGAVVSLKHVFEAGMAYVALSRTTSLNGLHIIDFDEKVIYCNDSVTTTMENMPICDLRNVRQLLTLHSELSGHTYFTVVHHNTEGLASHITDLKSHHELMTADVLCLTETFLSSETIAPTLQIPGYTLFNRNRNTCYITQARISTQGHGGVAIYIKNGIHAEEIQHMDNVTDLECLILMIQQPYHAIVVTIYRPQQYVVSECIKQLKNLLEGINTLNADTVIICGDFNEDLLSSKNKPILNLFDDQGFVQLIQDPTTDNNTLLDLIYIKDRNVPKLKGKGVLQTYYSYHNAVFCMLDV